MGVNEKNPLLYIGEPCSGVISHSFAGGVACLYTCKEPGKDGGNEDSAGLIPCGDTAGVLTLADGLGGIAGGDKASKTVINELNNIIFNKCEPGSLRDSILDGLEKANQTILNMGTGSATTIIAVEVNSGSIRSYHAGDSMALVTGQRGKIKHQTIPHSPVGYALESGLIPQDEAMTHDERHMISNVVGSTDMRLEIGSLLKLDRRDTLILGSDGLYDNLTIGEIIEIIRCGSLDRCAHELVSVCGDRMVNKTDSGLCKPDDMTFILFRRDDFDKKK